jgi:toxin ParE1/3/4
MTRRVRRSQQALYDLADHYRYIRKGEPDSAERFLNAAEALFLKLGDMPGIGRVWKTPHPKLLRVRVLHLPAPFGHYLVFYREDKSRVRILRVLHDARDLPALFG